MNSKNGTRIILSIHPSKSKPNLERVSTVYVPLGNWIFNPPLRHIRQQPPLRHSFGKRRKRARCDCHTSAYPVVSYVRKWSSSMFPSRQTGICSGDSTIVHNSAANEHSSDAAQARLYQWSFLVSFWHSPSTVESLRGHGGYFLSPCVSLISSFPHWSPCYQFVFVYSS